MVQAFNSQYDKISMVRAYSRAAKTYAKHAVLQREVANRMLERLDLIRSQPARIADLGCGPGELSKQLAKRYKGARIIALDIAKDMIFSAKKHRPWFSKIDFVQGDIEKLPFQQQSFDMVFANMSLHCCNDWQQLLKQLCQVLKPGGLLMFSVFGPMSLQELYQSFMATDNEAHVHVFRDMHDMGDDLLRAGFENPVMDIENFTLTYKDVVHLARDLKATGQQNCLSARRKTLTSKKRWQTMESTYEKYRDAQNRLPATFEVIYGHAWVPLMKKVDKITDKISIPVSTIKRY